MGITRTWARADAGAAAGAASSADEIMLRYWLDHVRIGLALSYGFVPVLAVYIVAQPGGVDARRLGALAVWLVLCVALTVLPWRRVVERGWIEWVTVVWSSSAPVLLALGMLARGQGVDSATLLMTFGPWLFATGAYRPLKVAIVAVTTVAALSVVHIAHPTAGPVRAATYLATFAVLLPVSLMMARLNHRRLNAMIDAMTRLGELATVDGLTGCRNHRAFHNELHDLLGRAAYDRQRLAVAMVDLDHFKRVNDEHGHDIGDDLLAAVGLALRSAVRPGDLVGRVGGEEFAVCLLDVDEDAARRVLDRVRDHVEAIRYPLPVGVSMGAVVAVPQDALAGRRLLRVADEALYRAKTGGRGRTEWVTGGPGERAASGTTATSG